MADIFPHTALRLFALGLLFSLAPAGCARQTPGVHTAAINPDIPRGLEPSVSCHGAFVTGLEAEAPTLAQAQSGAITFWSVKVTAEVGQSYSNWNYAQQKTLSCNPGNTTNSSICTARGNPCKPG